MAHPLASSLHKALTHKEVAVFGTARPAGGEVRLKGMIDGYSSTDGFALDYKSAEDASPAGARKAIWDRRYDIQEVQYRWLLDANGKVCNNFYFILVEKVPPFAVGVYLLSQHSRDKTTQLWENSIHDFSVCQSSGKYPAYSDSSVEVNL
jgi:exodeoxyribonuclease VIII